MPKIVRRAQAIGISVGGYVAGRWPCAYQLTALALIRQSEVTELNELRDLYCTASMYIILPPKTFHVIRLSI
jgi:hypothetical protein